MDIRETIVEMTDILINIVDSNVVYYVVVPLGIVILGWIKSAYEIKCKNKELGYWFKKYRRLETFLIIVLKIYKKLAVITILAMVTREIADIYVDKTMNHIGIGILCVVISLMVVSIEWKKENIQAEFLADGKPKKMLIRSLFILFMFSYFISDVEGKYGSVIVMIWFVMCSIWAIFLFRYSDVGLILDNRYADIYIKDNEKAEKACAGTIKKKGEWIIVRRYINEYEEEIRIKEADIVRIDYYGEPIVSLRKLWKRKS